MKEEWSAVFRLMRERQAVERANNEVLDRGAVKHVTHDRYISVIRNDQFYDYSTNDLQFFFNMVLKVLYATL